MVNRVSVVFAFMIIVSGSAVALAAYYLAAAVYGDAPSLNIETVEQLGILSSIVVFGLAGPVLVMKEVARINKAHFGLLLIAIGVIWSGTVGIVAVETARYTLAI